MIGGKRKRDRENNEKDREQRRKEGKGIERIGWRDILHLQRQRDTADFAYNK